MRIIAKRTLIAFYGLYPDSKGQLEAWHKEASAASWKTPVEIKQRYVAASILGNNRVVFNICGNKYRLVVKIAYQGGLVWIRFIGTHEEYDRIDAENM